MSLVDDVARSVRREAAAKQRITAVAQRVFGALDAQELGASIESSRELAAKMIAGLGIVPAPGDDIAVQLLDAFTSGWNAAVANQGRPFAGPARAPAALPPGMRVPTENYRLIGEPGWRASQALDGESIVSKYLKG